MTTSRSRCAASNTSATRTGASPSTTPPPRPTPRPCSAPGSPPATPTTPSTPPPSSTSPTTSSEHHATPATRKELTKGCTRTSTFLGLSTADPEWLTPTTDTNGLGQCPSTSDTLSTLSQASDSIGHLGRALQARVQAGLSSF